MRLEHWRYIVPLRLRSLLRREQVERELDDELRYHVDRRIDEYITKGLTPKEAQSAAMRGMRGIEQLKEECRDTRGVSSVENVLRDVRYGVRILTKSPGFTAVAVLTLALGIGANTAVVSVIKTVLLEPLPYPEPNRMVQLELSSPAWAPGKTENIASVPEFVVYRDQRQVFQQIAAYDRSARGVNLTGIDPEQVTAMHVSADYFQLFGTRIESGRTFTADEDRPGGPRLVVISDGLWRRRFGGDRGLLGKSLVLGGDPYEVIGIVGSAVAAQPSAEAWLPMQADPYSTNHAHTIRVAARLKPEVTLEIAQAQLKLAHEELRRKFPMRAVAQASEETFTAEPLWDATVGEVRRPLMVLLGAVSFVLLIACANVANLLMARATGRRREMAIRAALGASRRRIVSQLLTEGVLLSLTGGALGLLLGYVGMSALIGMGARDIPRIAGGLTLDWWMLAFTLLLSIGTGVLFVIVPALSSASTTQTVAALKESEARIAKDPSQSQARSVLVVAEMALALVLLAGAGLLIRTFWALRTVDPGFDAHNVLTMEVSLAGTRFHTGPALARLIRDAERRVESLPGVIAFAATYSLPLENQLGGPVTIEGRPNDRYGANVCFVSQRYFDVFRIPLLRGRPFRDQDDDRAPAVAMVNQAMAEGRSEGMRWSSTFPWTQEDPLRERITIGKTLGPPLEDRTRQIVGVVGEVRDSGLARKPPPMIYVPIAQLTDAMAQLTSGDLPLKWVIHTKTTPYSLTTDIERELRAASGGLPVAHIRTMEQVIGESTARHRFNMVLLSVFAGLALALAAIGVYGLMAYAVQHRTQEIGIRIALGARPKDVRRMVLLEGMRLALTGVVIGVAGGLALTRMMVGLLYGVQPSDPTVHAIVAVLLTAVALIAVYVPARRATRVDPVVALRWE
jgi:putative ABC transport system permease protein